MPVIPQTFKKDTTRFEDNPNDFYETPIPLIKGILSHELFDFTMPDKVLDPGCGTGNFGKAVRDRWPETHITGIDIDPDFNDSYDAIYCSDYLTHEFDDKFDLIIGNPPFSSDTDKRLAEKFIYRSMELLANQGMLCFLLKTEFLASGVRFNGLFKDHRPRHIFQSVDRIQWKKGSGNTIEYAFFIWYKPQMVDLTSVHWMKWRGVERTEFL